MPHPTSSVASQAQERPGRTRRPSAPVLVGGAVALSAGAMLVGFGTGLFLASEEEIHRPEGVIDSLTSISLVAAVALVIALAVALPTYRSAGRARIGAIALGALSVLTLPFIWSGAPAIFGSHAAWLGGLAKGSHVQTGVARGFGVVGLVVAVLTIVASLITLVGILVHGFA